MSAYSKTENDDYQDGSGNFATGTPLVELLGDTPRARILAVLVAHKSREFNVSELARDAGIARKTVYQHIEPLVEFRAVTELETSQGSRYTLADSQVGQKLYELEGVALREMPPKE